MKKVLLTTIVICQIGFGFHAQVGIGTNNPDPSSVLDLSSTDKGMLFPRMSSAQRNSIASPQTGLHVFDITTNTLWFYDGVNWINYAAQSKYGDVKSGIQLVDHDGWIKLDGRALNTLSASQQSVAVSLGFGPNIPNADNAYLVQNGGGVGTVAGSNTVTLSQANLPNVNFTGTASVAGDHNHAVDPASVSSSTNGSHNHTTDPSAVSTSTNGIHNHTMSFHNDDWNGGGGGNRSLEDDAGSWYNINTSSDGNHTHTVDIPATTSTSNGDHAHTVDIPSTTSTNSGNHSHTVSVASGGSATPVNIAPKSLTVNMFIYLGN